MAGLTGFVSLKLCLILVCLRNLIYGISVDLYLAPCNFIGCWRGVPVAERGSPSGTPFPDRLKPLLSYGNILGRPASITALCLTFQGWVQFHLNFCIFTTEGNN